MIRKAILFLAAAVFSNYTQAQFCNTVQVKNELMKDHPEIATYEAQLETQIQKIINNNRAISMARLTSADDRLDTIPVIVHIIHDYGNENVPDSKVFTMLDNLNGFYHCKKPYNDTAPAIAPFKKYVGVPNITFRLATIDPQGNPTRGIRRYYSYLTYGSDDFAKIDLWNPASYLNIWVEAFIGEASEGGGIVAAYAVFPSTAAALPWKDGVMTNSQFITTTGNGDGAVIPHEVGHYLNLKHTFGDYNQAGAPAVPCSDDDVDDTPPTHGNQFGCNVYDSTCATGYHKVYPSKLHPGTDSIVDYPDTVNVQNTMNYADCKLMFTKGQVERMHAALKSNVGNRNVLGDSLNVIITGANKAKPALPPIADFSIQNSTGVYTRTLNTRFFLVTNKNFFFKNQSWNDSVTSLHWTFPGGTPATADALTPTDINKAVAVSFQTPGWANVTLVANSNNGADTVTKTTVFVADPAGVAPKGYFQEFEQQPGNDLDKWPIFNYYNNEFKWKLNTSSGYYDHSSIMYTGWDYRSYPAIATGTPRGDFDDFFTRAFDLSGWVGSANCNLNFMYAGCYKSGVSLNMKDTLEIAWSADGTTWNPLDALRGGAISTIGSLGVPYAPLTMGDWKLYSHNIPTTARLSTVFFRFRYKPGTDKYGYGSGNNFYLDRINVNDDPLGISTMVQSESGATIVPNPTNNNAFVLIKAPTANSAKIVVSDVTGKQVYITEQPVVNGEARVEVPAANITTKGLYLVQINTGSQILTEKLVVY